MNIKKGVDILDGIEINNILNIAAEEGLCLLEDESIDLVITSPPYDNIRNYNNQNTNENIPFFDINIVKDKIKNNDELIVEFKERVDSITYKSFK